VTFLYNASRSFFENLFLKSPTALLEPYNINSSTVHNSLSDAHLIKVVDHSKELCCQNFLHDSESSALGGVRPKAETASVVGMKAESKNPSEDLPIKKRINN